MNATNAGGVAGDGECGGVHVRVSGHKGACQVAARGGASIGIRKGEWDLGRADERVHRAIGHIGTLRCHGRVRLAQ